MAELRLAQRRDESVSSIDMAMMERAIELAKAAAIQGEIPVGAVVYKGNRIIAQAANNREATCDPVGHAELLAMSAAGKALGDWRLEGCTLAVTLEPCAMCAGAMVNSRLSRVIYGASDPKAGACKSVFRIPTDKRLNHEVKVISGVMGERCGQLLKDFFKRRRLQNKQRLARIA